MDVRKPAKQMEMLWRGAKSFGDSADVFTSNFPTGACLLQLIRFCPPTAMPSLRVLTLLSDEAHTYVHAGSQLSVISFAAWGQCFLNLSQRGVCILSHQVHSVHHGMLQPNSTLSFLSKAGTTVQ